MIKKIIRKVKGSIFFKLIIILVVTGFLINFFVGFFFKLQLHPQRRVYFRNHFKRYVNYIILELGNPPQLKTAKKISGDLSIKIKYTGKNISWVTHNDFPGLKDQMKYFGMSDNQIKLKRGKLFYKLKNGEDRYFFIVDLHRFVDWEEGYIFVLLLFLSLILIIAYISIRKILKPIKLLTGGVDEISHGHFNYQVLIRKDDELGELTRSFNAMGKRIGEMLKSREQLLIDVSHELRSPITRIKVALEFIDNEEIRESMGDDISDIDKMISELLEAERLNVEFGDIKKEKINVVSFIEGIIGSYKKNPPGIKLLSSSDIEIDIDPERINIVVKNILENSFKYANSEIKPVEISIGEKENKCLINIKDYGIGIPEKDIPFIFEPFYRVDRSRSKETGGYGLGLSLSKRIMEAHGGEIEVVSNLDKGTTIILSFRLN